MLFRSDVYLGLVHRLDRPVGGVCVFARTSKAASRLSDQIRTHAFQKEYLAVVENDDIADSGHLEDLLLKDDRTNMVRVDPKGKEAVLDYVVIKRKGGLALLKIQLKTGRSHQIRVQFSSRNHPLWGDQRYNPHALPGQQIALWSYAIEFRHPTNSEMLRFVCETDRYPFDL